MGRWIAVVLTLALVAACITPGDVVRKRAAIERQCPETSIQITELPGSAFRADGCGRTEIFVCTVVEGSTQSCIKEAAPAAGPDAGPR